MWITSSHVISHYPRLSHVISYLFLKWLPYDFLMTFWMHFRWLSHDFRWMPGDFPMAHPWLQVDCPLTFRWDFNEFPMTFRNISGLWPLVCLQALVWPRREGWIESNFSGWISQFHLRTEVEHFIQLYLLPYAMKSNRTCGSTHKVGDRTYKVVALIVARRAGADSEEYVWKNKHWHPHAPTKQTLDNVR